MDSNPSLPTKPSLPPSETNPQLPFDDDQYPPLPPPSAPLPPPPESLLLPLPRRLPPPQPSMSSLLPSRGGGRGGVRSVTKNKRTAHRLPGGIPPGRKDVKTTPSLPRSESLPETPEVAANMNVPWKWNELVLGKKVGLEATEEASPGKKDEAAQLKNEEKNDGKEDQSGEPKVESMTQQTTVALDEGQASVTSGSYMVKRDPLGQTATPLTDDMREALIAPKTKRAKKCIRVLFQKLSQHVQVSETEKEGFEKVVLALIRYTVNTANDDIQVLVVRRMLEDICEAVDMLDKWKKKCSWPLKQLPVQTLELHDMTHSLVKVLFYSRQYPVTIPYNVVSLEASLQVVTDIHGFLTVVTYCKRFLLP